MNVVITGGTRGLGKALTKYFLKQGDDVIAVSRNAEDIAGKSRVELSDAILLSADVRSIKSMAYILGVANTYSFGRVDALVCCAGVYGPIGPSESVDMQDFKSCMETNFMGVVNACRVFIPLFKGQKNGKIVILSGGGATKPMPWLSAYAASKAAVVRYAETLAVELAGDGVDVNCVAPGMLPTQMTERLARETGEGIRDLAESARKCLAENDDMTDAVELIRFLCMPDSDGITGRLVAAKWDDWRGMKKGDLRDDDWKLRRMEVT